MLLNQANALSSDSFIRGIENGLRQAVAEGLGRLYSLSIADLTAGSRASGLLHGRAPVAQLDSASVFGTEGCRFESYRAYFSVAFSRRCCGELRIPTRERIRSPAQLGIDHEPSHTRCDRLESPLVATNRSGTHHGLRGDWTG